MNVLLKLSSAPGAIEEDIFYIIERFVILLYDRISTCHDFFKKEQ